MKTYTARGIRRPISLCVALCVTLSLPLAAQMTFEYTYGGSTCIEQGFRGAERVDIAGGCCDGGYIAVGTSGESVNGNPCGDFDVYVVRTDAMGGHVWEFVYDIGDEGWNDEGRCIREVQDGFIIAGIRTPDEPVQGANTDIFLLKIDCEGDVQWTQIYDGDGTDDFVNDLIVTDFGDGVTTFPGDFVLAGWSDRGGQNQNDALLMRTSSTGGLIWNKTYNALGTDPDLHNDHFKALIEAKVSSPGDIVAVGFSDSWSFIAGSPYGLQGLVARVDGNNGTIGVAPQGIAHYGSSDLEVFESVQELSTACQVGRLVFAGHITDQGVSQKILLIKSSGDPCLPLKQTVIGSSADPGTADAAFDLVEILTPGIQLGFSPVGDLAVVGKTRLTCENPLEPPIHDNALLLHVASSTLQATTGFHFGSTFQCLRNEVFRSVDDLGNSDLGFIMCGTTVDNQTVVTPPFPDPSNLYLVKTGKQGRTGCEEDWDFVQSFPDWEYGCPMTIQLSPMTEEGVPTVKAPRERPNDICVGTGSIFNEGRGPFPSDGNAPENGRGGLQPDFSEVEGLSSPSPLKRESTADKQTTTGTIRAKVKAKE